MIYLLHQMSQKPQKMAEGGMSMLPYSEQTPISVQPQGASPNGSMTVAPNQAQGGPAAQPVQNVVGQWANPGGVYSGITGGVGQGLGDVMGGLSKGMAQGTTFQNGYQAQLAPTQQYDYGQVIEGGAGNALQGYQQYLQNLAQQQQLAGVFGQDMAGNTPSVAQTQLATSTGNNVANQASLMASGRGANANAGMTARNAARTGAAVQQAGAGEAATLRAQEQQKARENLLALYNQIGNQGISEQGANTNLFGTAAGANNAQNTNLVNNYAMAQGINADVAGQNTAALNKSASSGMGAIGGMLAMINKGGMAGVDGYADGGEVSMGPLADGQLYGTSLGMPGSDNGAGAPAGGYGGDPLNPSMGPLRDSQLYAASLPPSGGAGTNPYAGGGGGIGNDAQSFVGQYLNSSKARQQEANKPTGIGALMSGITGMMGGAAQGAIVPGQAQVSGDSEKNDTVHALLSPGEIVVPRTAAQDPEKAAQFAKRVALNHGRKGKK